LIVIISTFFTYYMIFYFIDHKEMLKCKVGRIMTKLMHRHSLWTSYQASYPTMLIYDEIDTTSWCLDFISGFISNTANL
jgi:hypothetical protein